VAPALSGVDHSIGTNNPSIAGNFTEWQVVHYIRVDLSDPGVHLFSTPQGLELTLLSSQTGAVTTLFVDATSGNYLLTTNSSSGVHRERRHPVVLRLRFRRPALRVLPGGAVADKPQERSGRRC